MATYTDVAVTINWARVYSDSGLTALVETLSLSSVATGIYEATSALTRSLYSYGQTYYMAVNYTPSGDSARTQSFPFVFAPRANASEDATDTDTDCEGYHLQAPYMGLRIGRGGYREADLTNAVYAPRNRWEAVFNPAPGARGKLLYVQLFNYRAGEPMCIARDLYDLEGAGADRVAQG